MSSDQGLRVASTPLTLYRSSRAQNLSSAERSYFATTSLFVFGKKWLGNFNPSLTSCESILLTLMVQKAIRSEGRRVTGMKIGSSHSN
jgi:hypothetical protein